MIGKRSLHPIASPGGVICLQALDHREAMRNAFRRAGVEDVNANEMLETKSRIVEAVGSAATGVLLDHAAARVSRPDGIGLLVPLEEQGHEQLDGARLNRLEFTAEDALRIGADGCKLLLHYRPDHLASARRQREVIARAADDWHGQGLPLVLEPLVYRRVPRRRLGLHGRSHDLGRCTRSRPDGPAALAGRTCPTTVRTPLRDCP